MSSRNPPTADIRDPKQSAYVNESLVEEIEWISQLNDRLGPRREAGVIVGEREALKSIARIA